MITAEEILRLASQHGLIDDMQLGLERGASANHVNDMGYSVLHLAAISDHPVAVRLLAAHGADLNVLNDAGETPVQMAIDLGRHLTAAALIELGCECDLVWPNGDTLLHKLAGADKWFFLGNALQLDLDIHRRNHAGKTALQVAASVGAFRCVKALLMSGAQIGDVENSESLQNDVMATLLSWRAGMAIQTMA